MSPTPTAPSTKGLEWRGADSAVSNALSYRTVTFKVVR
jgi:hypothetical protein